MTAWKIKSEYELMLTTHLGGQLGPVSGAVSAAILQSSVGPLLEPLLVTLPAEPDKQSH